jgi:hypothetical protein
MYSVGGVFVFSLFLFWFNSPQHKIVFLFCVVVGKKRRWILSACAITRITAVCRSSRRCTREGGGGRVIMKDRLPRTPRKTFFFKFIYHIKMQAAIWEWQQQLDKKEKRANKLLDHSLGSRDWSRTGYDTKWPGEQEKKERESLSHSQGICWLMKWADNTHTRRTEKKFILYII